MRMNRIVISLGKSLYVANNVLNGISKSFKNAAKKSNKVDIFLLMFHKGPPTKLLNFPAFKIPFLV